MSISLKPVRMAIALSGRGSNASAILQAVQRQALTSVQPVAIVSNRDNAVGLRLADEYNLEQAVFAQSQYGSLDKRDEALAVWLNEHDIDVLVLAGYNRILTESFFNAYFKPVLNIHPSVLPKFGGKGMVGLAVHQAVIDAAETESGCTVHQVELAVDAGQILGQAIVPVYPDDTADTLAARVLAQEHRLYGRVLQEVGLALHHGYSLKSVQPIKRSTVPVS